MSRLESTEPNQQAGNAPGLKPQGISRDHPKRSNEWKDSRDAEECERSNLASSEFRHPLYTELWIVVQVMSSNFYGDS